MIIFQRANGLFGGGNESVYVEAIGQDGKKRAVGFLLATQEAGKRGDKGQIVTRPKATHVAGHHDPVLGEEGQGVEPLIGRHHLQHVGIAGRGVAGTTLLGAEDRLEVIEAGRGRVHERRQVHRVRNGDTLGGIAARYRVSVSQLRAWNKNGKNLQIGQRIQIR